MLLLLFGMRPHPEVLMVVSAAPLSMAYLWLQVLPLARFNQMIVDWQLSTENNDTFRILWQKERDLMFLVQPAAAACPFDLASTYPEVA